MTREILAQSHESQIWLGIYRLLPLSLEMQSQMLNRLQALLLASFGLWTNLSSGQQVTPTQIKLPSQTITADSSDSVARSVVKVFATIRYPSLYKPWTKEAPSEVTGSGVVIDGKRILTCAHVVQYAGDVQIQGNQSGNKMTARVEYIAPEIDLAVLKLEDDGFFDTHPPLPREEILPDIKDSVMVYGYPEGGTTLSITKGIVSRVEFTVYTYPTFGLRIQIDAAINAGNSGGPAIAGEKMIGLAFSRLNDADNIGYIIPNEEIALFLKDIADGHYDGKPGMFDDWQTLENPALRDFLKLNKSVEGVVVHKPLFDTDDYPLKVWDTITKIGDTPIDNQGMIRLNSNVRVHLAYLVQKNAKDGKVPLTIIRAGKQLQIQLPVRSSPPTIFTALNSGYPSYFIYGPMVFTGVSREYVQGFLGSSEDDRWARMLAINESPLLRRLGSKPAFTNEELVIVPCPFFPHKLVEGYGNPQHMVVKAVNGIHVKNLQHLVEILRDNKSEFVTVEFDARWGETMVFPHQKMLAATDDVLADNGIRAQGSPDMLAIWNAKKN